MLQLTVEGGVSDYLTLFEAHQRRLEDVGSPTQGQGKCE